jgi:predicted LPLAT superfamily acyltransferase
VLLREQAGRADIHWACSTRTLVKPASVSNGKRHATRIASGAVVLIITMAMQDGMDNYRISFQGEENPIREPFGSVHAELRGGGG